MTKVHLPIHEHSNGRPQAGLAIEPQETGGFEPRIIAFVCKWCTYAGADLAGTSRMTYAPNVRTIMLPCTGRIDISLVVRAFLQGADGVIVSGCHPGDCHYISGNYRARRRWMLLRDLLDTLGVDLRRLDLAWVSAAEGAKWVKTIQQFTDDMRQLGPYAALHAVAGDYSPDLAPLAGSDQDATEVAVDAADAGVPLDPALAAAMRQALEQGTAKAILGWKRRLVPGPLQPTWITDASAVGQLLVAVQGGNLTRLFKQPQVRKLGLVGLIVRYREALALNVLLQEKQFDPQQTMAFGVDGQGHFLGVVDWADAGFIRRWETSTSAAEKPSGFSEQTWQSLDNLMALSSAQRWDFWQQHFVRCIKCYACRGSCPMCNCGQCFTDKNMPQWFPTAADGPGNFSWHLVRAFHLAGRCVGCGACEETCPAGIPLGLLNASLARSAWKHFGHRAGATSAGVPLQADFRANDLENFIL